MWGSFALICFYILYMLGDLVKSNAKQGKKQGKACGAKALLVVQLCPAEIRCDFTLVLREDEQLRSISCVVGWVSLTVPLGHLRPGLTL